MAAPAGQEEAGQEEKPPPLIDSPDATIVRIPSSRPFDPPRIPEGTRVESKDDIEKLWAPSDHGAPKAWLRNAAGYLLSKHTWRM